MDFDVKTFVTHTSEGHWVATSNIGTAHPEVVVYDSICILHSSNASQSTNSKPSCNTAANYRDQIHGHTNAVWYVCLIAAFLQLHMQQP